MAEIGHCGGVGKFRRSRSSAPPPVRAELDRPGDGSEGVRKALALTDTRYVLHDLADRTQKHPTARVGQDGELGTGSEEGGAYTGIHAAGNVNELQAQVAKLIDAFRREEGRDPDVGDAGFWRAYKELIQAFAAENADGLDVERKRAEMERIPDAVSDGDPEHLKVGVRVSGPNGTDPLLGVVDGAADAVSRTLAKSSRAQPVDPDAVAYAVASAVGPLSEAIAALSARVERLEG